MECKGIYVSLKVLKTKMSINRNIVECKVVKKWLTSLTSSIVLIETLWNVKTARINVDFLECRINRNIVECKDLSLTSLMNCTVLY